MYQIKKLIAGVVDGINKWFLELCFLWYHQNAVLSSPGLAIHGAASPVVKIGSAFYIMVNGVINQIAAADLPALNGGGTVTANNNKCLFMFTVDGAGNTYTIPGTQNATSFGALLVPNPGDGQVPIGLLIINNASGAGFTPGTTALDTASLNPIYINYQPGSAYPTSVPF